MGFSVRYLLCREREVIKIPRARYERFCEEGTAEFQEYAGEVLDIAELAVLLENGHPVAVAHESYFRVGVNDDGTADTAFEQQSFTLAAARIDPASSLSAGSVIEAGDVFRERALESKVTWVPSPSLKQRLMDIVLGRIKQ